MGKLTLKYLMLCDNAIQDINNKISLIGIFENFNVHKLPAALPTFNVVGKLVLNDDNINSIKGILEVVGPKGNSITKLPPINIGNIPTRIVNNERNVGLIFKIVGFPFKETGIYKFRVIVNEEPIGEVPLEVRMIQ